MKDEVKEFKKDFREIERCENIEIDFIMVAQHFNDLLLPLKKYNLLERSRYGEDVKSVDGNYGVSVGYWGDKKVYQSEFEEDYTIKTTKLFSICSSCLNEELYNEQKDEYYCPSCLEHRPWHYRISNLYRKVKSYLPERVKQ